MACGMDNSKHTCEKEITTNNKEKKCCCSSDNPKENNDKGCDGNCKETKCGCTSTCTSVSMSFLLENYFSIPNMSFSLSNKETFLYATPVITDGYYSIWLIPKIG